MRAGIKRQLRARQAALADSEWLTKAAAEPVKPDKAAVRRRTPQATIDRELRGGVGLPHTVTDYSAELLRDTEAAQRHAARLEVQQRLQNAVPTGEKCCTRACVFPAVLDGLCRKCFLEARMDYSILKSFFTTLISPEFSV